VTTGQPSTNPRAVKEADALVEAGFDVRLIGAHWATWADAADQRLLRVRPWTADVIDWQRHSAPFMFWKSRVRHRVARACMAVPGLSPMCLRFAVSRMTPELTRAATGVPADIYIAHNLGALPAAWTAAQAHGAVLGFDAEDFHSGEFAVNERSSHRLAVEQVEREYLPRCDYVTAASVGIAEAYEPFCRARPTVVLNVFPLANRPSTRRPTRWKGPLTLYWFSQTIGPGRGLEDAVQAMGRAASENIELHVRGVWQDGFRHRLMRLAADCGVRGERIVSHQPGDADEMVKMAALFDVGLALEPGLTPNSAILLSNKVFTYVLAGNALILTRTPGQRRLLPSLARAAVSYESGDIDTLAAALHRWSRERFALDLARAASWECGAAYNWDREKATFLDAVSGVLTRSAEPQEPRGSAA
jgi:hypothetical protein